MKTKQGMRRMLALAAILSLCLSISCAQAAAYTTLAYGSRGADVLKLQNALLNLGYDLGNADGKFGKVTETAVKLYQAAMGLTADGKAGSLTLGKLYANATDSGASAGTVDTAGTATSTNPNTLKYGDSGAKVTALQTALKALGYYTSTVDGRYGSGTRQAIVRFQTANGLTADGLAGTQTQTLLYAKAASDGSSGTSSGSASSSASGFTRTLRKGYTGGDVTNVQTRLKELGYYTYSVDGSYGAGTMSAVRAFQTANGLSADGLTGSLTYALLFSSSAVAAGSSGGGASSTTDASASSGSASTSTATSTSDSSLRYGATGSAVTKLQKALQALGYNVTADGDYGALTKTAVAAFQKQNGLTSDGVAGSDTLALLYSGGGQAADSSADSDMVLTDDTGKASGPSASQVKLLHWYNDVKPSLSGGSKLTIFDPSTNLQWTLRVYARGRHCDSEPLTLTDTKIMYKAFGYTNTWTPKAVYVQLPSGTWSLASMHNVPHLTGSITDNGFDGHLCVHFLRDMDECTQNDPNYGVTNQKLIRSTWKKMTGITVE